MTGGTRVDTVTVRYVDGQRFVVHVRDHNLTVDQPIADGGSDTAATPTELFVSSLTTCVAFYAHRFLARHGLPSAGLTVTATYTMAARPTRVSDINVTIQPPDSVPTDRLAALLAVASHCTVHNSLSNPPTVAFELANAENAA